MYSLLTPLLIRCHSWNLFLIHLHKHAQLIASLYRLNLEMHSDEREHHTTEILDEEIKQLQTVGILAILDVNQRPDFRGDEGYVLIAYDNLQLLSTNRVGGWPS
mmetsp:Transcript_7725/g.14381  ORF Transcript_7725/g.14381 Transcript_7725/m.14381 type:complete len:104 (-) Transcript_7725:255-566(-)